jgi:hypothetical protein
LPGETRQFTTNWSTTGDVGDFDVVAQAQLFGQSELRTDDNVAIAHTFVTAGGFKGFGPCDLLTDAFGVCGVAPPPPPPVQPPPHPHLTARKIIHETNTTATDAQESATTALSFAMPHTSASRFDFSDPTAILDSNSTAPDGTVTSCTVWRFVTPRGSITARIGSDGISGNLDVPFASRFSQGTTSTRTREQYYLLPDTKPIQTRDEDMGSSSTASSPRSSYRFPNASSVEVVGTNVRGDFSQCISLAPNGTSVERLTFAALPANINQPQPNLSGFGDIASLQVSYHSAETTTQVIEDDPPTPRDLTQGVTG